MHRPSQIKAFRAIYNRHTLMHHQFFTEQEMRFADHHDWRVTFFPPYALVTFTMMSIPPALVLGWMVSPNVGWLLISTTTSMYLIYEFMHFCCHVDDNWFVRNVPFVNTIRRHHAAHHNQSIMMERNMNLTFPIMDWLFGTSDLDRGLLGHLFNGYDTRFVKTDMRKTSRTPKPEHGAAVDGICHAGRIAHESEGKDRCRRSSRTGFPRSVSPALRPVCTLAFLVLAGMFPLRARPDAARSSVGALLVGGNAILLAALLVGTGLYGYAELRWSTLVVVAGLVVLFTPGLFEVWPASLRDGRAGLVVLVGVQIAGARDAGESRGAIVGKPVVNLVGD